MKISFDYDDTLTEIKVQLLAMDYIDRGDDVYIISARRDKRGMLRLAEKLRIPENRVYATGSNKSKIEKILELGIEKHFDNNAEVIDKLGRIGKKIP